MEIREEYTINSPDYSAKLLRLPTELHEWFKVEASRQDRSVNAEMVRVLRAWRRSKEIISASDVKAAELENLENK